MQIFDITQPMHRLMSTYPDHPGIKLEQVKLLADDGENVCEMSLGLHTGTHVDSPVHYLDKGLSIDQIELSKFFGASLVLDFSSKEQSITLEDIQLKDELIKENDIVLLKTKNSINISTEFNSEYIYLQSEVVEYFVEKNVKAVGIDGPSIDQFGAQPSNHEILFDKTTPIYKNLYLANAMEGRYLFYGFPLKIEGGEASPVRVILLGD